MHTHTRARARANTALIRDGGGRVMKMIPISNIATTTGIERKKCTHTQTHTHTLKKTTKFKITQMRTNANTFIHMGPRLLSWCKNQFNSKHSKWILWINRSHSTGRYFTIFSFAPRTKAQLSPWALIGPLLSQHVHSMPIQQTPPPPLF